MRNDSYIYFFINFSQKYKNAGDTKLLPLREMNNFFLQAKKALWHRTNPGSKNSGYCCTTRRLYTNEQLPHRDHQDLDWIERAVGLPEGLRNFE